ncbi:MAG: 50S ribosomal protein L5, partial [Parvularculaceae bacterium]|nr:50S ribosomal protein L5 [Parvularculaceae bacterium]
MSETASYTPRLKAAYNDTIRAKIQEELGLKNVMQIPKLEKVVINMGVGDAVNDRKSIEKAFEEMQAIAGQKPVVTKAKNSIAGFKVREEMALGVKVTLRKDRT